MIKVMIAAFWPFLKVGNNATKTLHFGTDSLIFKQAGVRSLIPENSNRTKVELRTDKDRRDRPRLTEIDKDKPRKTFKPK